jgi:hypothetical protein
MAGTIKQLLSSPGVAGSKSVPRKELTSRGNVDPFSKTSKVMAVMVSNPAPVLQILIEYFTSIRQKWVSGSASDGAPSARSQMYPAKVNKSSSLVGPKVSFNTRSRGLPSSQVGSIEKDSPEPVISQLIASASSGTSLKTTELPALNPLNTTLPPTWEAEASRY